MTPSRLPNRVRSLAGLALASTVLLTGCGGAVPAFSPGLAARVGDETVTSDRVDEVAGDFCDVLEKQPNAQAVPQHYLRGFVAGTLALRSAAEQLAAKYDVEPAPSYEQQIAQLRSTFSSLPQDELDALVEVQGNQYFVTAVAQSVGDRILAEQGEAAPSKKKAIATGQKALNDWLDEHDVDFDPKLGVGIQDGRAVPVDTSVSFALSDTAKKGGSSQPDATYAAGLPDAQRCG